MEIVNIAIFASGNGTNAENIVKHFSGNSQINVSLILTNNKDAYVITRANELGVKTEVFTPKELNDSCLVDEVLSGNKIDFIILAGFLLKIPERIVSKYRGKIINIHPALLPAYGGKGMYGQRVHRAVIENAEKESGITIHLVDEIYDNGDIIFQAKCNLDKGETVETLAAKIHLMEREFFPAVTEDFIKKRVLSLL